MHVFRSETDLITYLEGVLFEYTGKAATFNPSDGNAGQNFAKGVVVSLTDAIEAVKGLENYRHLQEGTEKPKPVEKPVEVEEPKAIARPAREPLTVHTLQYPKAKYTVKYTEDKTKKKR